MLTENPHPTEPVLLSLDVAAGRLRSSNERYEKRLAELRGVYRDEAAFEAALEASDGRPVYWVESSRTQPGAGGLITGLSVLEAGRIGDEFAMTRGHLHEREDRGETYVAIEGRGVMLLETLAGESRAIEFVPGQAVYVPGGWIHRSVNVGTSRFTSLFCYAADAGQDYDVIARARGMRSLVVADERDPGERGWTTRRNPDHLGYRLPANALDASS